MNTLTKGCPGDAPYTVPHVTPGALYERTSSYTSEYGIGKPGDVYICTTKINGENRMVNLRTGSYFNPSNRDMKTVRLVPYDRPVTLTPS